MSFTMPARSAAAGKLTGWVPRGLAALVNNGPRGLAVLANNGPDEVLVVVMGIKMERGREGTADPAPVETAGVIKGILLNWAVAALDEAGNRFCTDGCTGLASFAPLGVALTPAEEETSTIAEAATLDVPIGVSPEVLFLASIGFSSSKSKSKSSSGSYGLSSSSFDLFSSPVFVLSLSSVLLLDWSAEEKAILHK